MYHVSAQGVDEHMIDVHLLFLFLYQLFVASHWRGPHHFDVYCSGDGDISCFCWSEHLGRADVPLPPPPPPPHTHCHLPRPDRPYVWTLNPQNVS